MICYYAQIKKYGDNIVINLVTDAKLIKSIKAGLADNTVQHPAIRIDQWVYNSDIFRNLSYDANGFKASADIINYLYCSSYNDFLKAYHVQKSSFVFDTFRRYKHYALEYVTDTDTYYFTLSYNADRGMDFIFYPHLLKNGFDTAAYSEFDSTIYLEYAKLMYSFLTEFYASILNHLFDSYDLNSILSYFEKSYRNSKGAISVLGAFEQSRDISMLMPKL